MGLEVLESCCHTPGSAMVSIHALHQMLGDHLHFISYSKPTWPVRTPKLWTEGIFTYAVGSSPEQPLPAGCGPMEQQSKEQDFRPAVVMIFQERIVTGSAADGQ